MYFYLFLNAGKDIFFNVVILAFLPKQRLIVFLALQQCVLLLVDYILHITGKALKKHKKHCLM